MPRKKASFKAKDRTKQWKPFGEPHGRRVSRMQNPFGKPRLFGNRGPALLKQQRRDKAGARKRLGSILRPWK